MRRQIADPQREDRRPTDVKIRSKIVAGKHRIRKRSALRMKQHREANQ